MLETLVLHPSAMAQWHALIKEASHTSGIDLNENLESYLVFLLMDHCRSTEITTKPLALDFLENIRCSKRESQQILREVGDKCLIFSGLFPKIASRKSVGISYYVKLGQSAYGSLSGSYHNHLALLFSELCEHFIQLMDVLHTIRTSNPNATTLNLIEAEELWQQTRSTHALSILQTKTKGFFIPTQLIDPTQKH
jgi:hypothetical protein